MSSRWEFFIASPGISFEGPRKGYEWIRRALHDLSARDRGAVIPFERITIQDTNTRLIESLRRSFGIPGLRNHFSSGRFFDTSYFDEMYIYEIAPIVTLDCPVQTSLDFRYVRGHSRIYVVAHELAMLTKPGIIGHGTLRRKKEGELRVKIEVPATYGIDSCATISCKPIAPIAGFSEHHAPAEMIQLLLIEPSGN